MKIGDPAKWFDIWDGLLFTGFVIAFTIGMMGMVNSSNALAIGGLIVSATCFVLIVIIDWKRKAQTQKDP